MRVDAILSLPATAEYWDFTSTQDPISGEFTHTYVFERTIRLVVTEDRGQPLVYTRELLDFDSQLRNITDGNGTTILDQVASPRVAYVGSPIAQFDVFGNVIGYKYALTTRPL